MKAIERHLYLRNAHYYYRSSFPRSLHSIIKQKEFVIALNTQDISFARVQSEQINCELNKFTQNLAHACLSTSAEETAGQAIQAFLSNVEKLKYSYG